MKTLKTLLVTKSIIAAAIAASALAAPAFAATSGPIVIDIPGTPDNGLVCRTGYTGALVGSAFKCSKSTTIEVVLECPLTFPKYVTRVPKGSASTGEDLCIKNSDKAPAITPNSSLTGLILGQDYEKATPNLAPNRIANMGQAEATALGLAAGEVDTSPGQPTIVIDGDKNKGGGIDNAKLPVTFFTFAVPQSPLKSFVARPLP